MAFHAYLSHEQVIPGGAVVFLAFCTIALAPKIEMHASAPDRAEEFKHVKRHKDPGPGTGFFDRLSASSYSRLNCVTVRTTDRK